MIQDFIGSKKYSKAIHKILKAAFPSGQFTARDVVDYARPVKSPLHKFFEWNDSAAAELYRVEQARKIIQCVVVQIDGGEIRAFQNVYIKKENRRSYTSTENAKSSTELWQQVLDSALREISFWKERYKTLKQLSPIITAIEEVELRNGKEKNINRRSENNDTSNRVQASKSNAHRRIPVASK